MSEKRRNDGVILAFTLILVGYLQSWLPHPNAGMALLGLEMGEWVKFLPSVRAGEVAWFHRNFFYLPPITLALGMLLWSNGWPRTPRTLAMRLLACALSLLAMPSILVILREPSAEWSFRLLLISFVVTVALYLTWRSLPPYLLTLGGLLVALMGAILPTLAYLLIRPIIAEWHNVPVLGIGIGVWLNLIGHLLCATPFFPVTRFTPKNKKPHPTS